MRTPLCFVALLAAAGCASGPPTVRNADYVRLPATQSAQLSSATEEVRASQEELSRAKDGVSEARKEGSLVEADRKTAKEETARVERLVEAAEVRRRAADARGEYAEKLMDARRAEEVAAQAKVDMANAKVELLKFQALEQAQAPALAQYDKGAFYEHAAKAQRKADEAQAEARKLAEQATAAKREWEDLARRARND